MASTLAAMHIDVFGNVSSAKQVPSPNWDERPEGELITLVVIHSISLPPGEFGGDSIERLFTNTLDHSLHPYFQQLRGLRVSAHFLIRRDGELIQFVSTLHRAWHAGESQWGGRARCNDFSVGIELEGADEQCYAAAQYQSLAQLINGLKSVYPVKDIVGHSDIAPGRKTDPGPAFSWAALHQLLSP